MSERDFLLFLGKNKVRFRMSDEVTLVMYTAEHYVAVTIPETEFKLTDYLLPMAEALKLAAD